MTAYRLNLAHTYNILLDMHEKVFTRIINLEMLGNLAHISHSFQEGESYHFEMQQFRDSKDENVLLLVGFVDRLEEVMNSLSNINILTEGELEEAALEFEEEED